VKTSLIGAESGIISLFHLPIGILDMAASATTYSHWTERIEWKKTFSKPTAANAICWQET